MDPAGENISADLFRLNGRVAVITGGNGYLGGAMAKALAHFGAKTVIIGRNAQTVEERADEIALATGNDTLGVVADVLLQQDLEAATSRIKQRFGRIDILVNAAGGNMETAVIEPEESFFDKPLDAQRDVIELNLMGTLRPIVVFGQEMSKETGGTIINISSESVPRAITRVPGYSMGKAAIENFTRWLAVDLAKKFGDKMRVNAIRPGFFITDQNRNLLTLKNQHLTERGKKIIQNTPMGRFGCAEELAGPVVFLASDASGFLTGEVITVDGGFNAFSGI